jgi:hypothetical protein
MGFKVRIMNPIILRVFVGSDRLSGQEEYDRRTREIRKNPVLSGSRMTSLSLAG